MARPRSDDKRNAILNAAMRIIAAQGLGAPTALIAKEAGVSNGSLFTYFETKSALLNQLYVDLKTEMAATVLGDLPAEADTRGQMAHMWSRWLRWATSHPDKRRALALLAVSGELSEASVETGHRAMAGVANLLERSRKNGPLRDAPLALVAGLMTAMAETTVDFMMKDPAHAEAHGATSFEAVWRMIG